MKHNSYSHSLFCNFQSKIKCSLLSFGLLSCLSCSLGVSGKVTVLAIVRVLLGGHGRPLLRLLRLLGDDVWSGKGWTLHLRPLGHARTRSYLASFCELVTERTRVGRVASGVRAEVQGGEYAYTLRRNQFKLTFR